MLQVTDLAPTLQTLFGDTADEVATQTRFSLRRRILTGPRFARLLVFGWLGRPTAPLEALLASSDLPVTPQALHARVNPVAAEFLAALLTRALGLVVSASAATIPLLRRFPGVYAEDLTDLGDTGKALVRYELSGGAIETLEVLGPKASEVASSAALPPLRPGSLRLADRGFFDGAALRQRAAQGIHWVTRVPTAAKVSVGDAGFVPLADWLAGLEGDAADVSAVVGETDPVAGRLTVRRCPPAVAAERLRRAEATARRKGRPVGYQQRVLCGWTVYFTDLPADRWSAAELEVLYRCRWQVELLFKRFKSLGGVGSCGGRKPERHRVELLAKLLASVVAEWACLLGGGPLAATGPVPRQRQVRAAADALRAALGCRETLISVLAGVVAGFVRMAKRKRRKSPSTRQLLFRPRLIA
jgi:Transposase DDE domain